MKIDDGSVNLKW